jgi:hypothetical protein
LHLHTPRNETNTALPLSSSSDTQSDLSTEPTTKFQPETQENSIEDVVEDVVHSRSASSKQLGKWGMCKHIKLSHTHTCTGCKPLRRLPMPSTVTTCIPSTEYRGARHALIARCLQCTINQTNQLGLQIGLFFQFLGFLLSLSFSLSLSLISATTTHHLLLSLQLFDLLLISVLKTPEP